MNKWHYLALCPVPRALCFCAMCILAVWLDQDPDRPLVIGANRDEAYGRRSARPSPIEPGIVAGRDLEKGGTWLGITESHLVVAITNRFQPVPTANSYSRGHLALDALRSGSLERAERAVREKLAANHLAGFNLVAIHGREGRSVHYDGQLRVTRFGPGVHVVSSDRDINDPAMPEKRALDAFLASNPGVPGVESLRGFLAEHDGARPVCKHGDAFGTVSSTILTVTDRDYEILHADGPPCRTPFLPVP